MDMTNFGKVNYSKNKIPEGYKCSDCGATNCKLWRKYQTFLNHQNLLCAKCASNEQKEDISSINENGLRKSDYGLTDQIGWRIPAVPTEDGETFWGYTSTPMNGYEWWKRLETLPKEIKKDEISSV